MSKKEVDLKKAILSKVNSRDREVIELVLEYIDAKLEFLNDLQDIEDKEEI